MRGWGLIVGFEVKVGIRRVWVWWAAVLVCLSVGGAGWARDGADEVRIPVTDWEGPGGGTGSEGAVEGKWGELDLPKSKATVYSRVELEDGVAIKGVSDGGASGLVYPIDIDPLAFSIIEWSWKVESPVEGGNLQKKSGDDYAARVYLTFEYDKSKLPFLERLKYAFIKTFTDYDIPLRAINYVWANQAEVGTVAPNPYTSWVYMVVADSGEADAGVWRMHSRNYVEDYRAAFEEEPGRITGVAIMTDTDDTKSTATGYFRDIVFRKQVD